MVRLVKRILAVFVILGLLAGGAFIYLRFGPGIFSAERWEAGASALIAQSDRTHQTVLDAVTRYAAAAADPETDPAAEPGGEASVPAGAADPHAAQVPTRETLWLLLRSAVAEQQAVEQQLDDLFAAMPALDALFWVDISREPYIDYVHARQTLYAQLVEGLRSGDPAQLTALVTAFQEADTARRDLLGIPPVPWAPLPETAEDEAE